MKIYLKSLVIAAFALGALTLASCTATTKNETPAPAKTPEAAAANSGEPVKIMVSTSYEPKFVEVKKGQPVKLAFLRKDDKNCGDEVVFPKLNIRKKLPVGETVVVEFTPEESGEIAFTCGMDMMRGKIVVKE